MKTRVVVASCLACLFVTTWGWIQSSVSAQTGSGAPRSSGASAFRNGVPPAALLTDRGADLAQQLRILRSKESALGERHPGLAAIRQEIANISEQLRAFEVGPNPFRRSEVTSSDGESLDVIPPMNERDLEQITLMLARDVQGLKSQMASINRRLRKLERQAMR